MRTFNLSNYFGTTVTQTFGRPWYLFWKMAQLSYPVYRSLCWKHNRYLVLVNNAVAHSKQISTSFGRHERFLQQLWIPTYDCYLLCWISEKKTNKQRKKKIYFTYNKHISLWNKQNYNYKKNNKYLVKLTSSNENENSIKFYKYHNWHLFFNVYNFFFLCFECCLIVLLYFIVHWITL